MADVIGKENTDVRKNKKTSGRGLVSQTQCDYGIYQSGSDCGGADGAQGTESAAVLHQTAQQCAQT